MSFQASNENQEESASDDGETDEIAEEIDDTMDELENCMDESVSAADTTIVSCCLYVSCK